MPTRPRSRKTPNPTRSTKNPDHTLVDSWQQGYDGLWATYIAERARLSVPKRLDELLWSFPFEVVAPLPVPGSPKRSARFEERYGDKCLTDRREQQNSALASCDVRGISRAALCEIGERARDAERRFEVKNMLLPAARDFRDGTDAMRKWRRLSRQVMKIIAQRTEGRVDDPAGRFRAMQQEVQGYVDAADVMLPASGYRHGKAGRHERPWTKTAHKELRALGVLPDFCEGLLIAWCLKAIPPDER